MPATVAESPTAATAIVPLGARNQAALAISLFTPRPSRLSSIQSRMNGLLFSRLYKALRFEPWFLWLIPISCCNKVLVTCLAGRHPPFPIVLF